MDGVVNKKTQKTYGKMISESIDRETMLASVTRLHIKKAGKDDIKATFEAVFQAYNGRTEGRNMSPWGAKWQ